MQDFNFAQIQSTVPKFRLNFAQKILLGGAFASPAPTAPL